MSAVIVKGIIISLSVVAAVGIALQSPEVREWLEEQRQKLAEMLRSVSEGLDAHTRSQAEAFAYEGRLPTQQEMQGIDYATAVATGRDTDADATQRRLQRQSSAPSIDAAERRRLGREYLAKRNQELLEMKHKRKSEVSEKSDIKDNSTADDVENSAVKTLEGAVATGTFDQLINEDGSLKLSEKTPVLVGDTETQVPSREASIRAFQSGSHFGNPFGDEFAMSEPLETDGSQTPKPPVPPKISLGPPVPVPVPGSFPPDPPISEPAIDRSIPTFQPMDDLSYDEQLARALSISLAESEEQARTTLRRRLTEDEEFAQAIEDSLKEAKQTSNRGPLVDFSSDLAQPLHTPQMITNPWSARSEDEDLYTLTPMPTGSRALHADAPLLVHSVNHSSGGVTFSNIESPNQLSTNESSQYGSFQFSPSNTLSPPRAVPMSPSSGTLSPEVVARDTISTGFHTDSDGDDFASLPGSSAQSIGSLVEVEDVDIDSMSDDDDGVRTPQSWSEVGSEVADSERSERSESEAGDMVRV